MKLKSTLIAAFSAAAMATSQAFVIDFNDINQIGSDAFTQVGSTIGSSTGDGGTGGITIDVAGYGLVTITQTTFSGGSDLIIGNLYSDGLNNVNSIQLSSNGDQVTVTFPTDVILFNAQSLDQGTSEGLVIEGSLAGSVHIITASLIGTDLNGEPGIGIQAIKFDVVPEPSSAALGAIGMSMILLRRRKA